MLLRDCYAFSTVRALVIFLLLSGCMPTMAQRAAPTAISDAGYTACSHASCLFVPDDELPQVYRQGDLSYTVKEDGSFTLSRDSRVLLSTHLADLSASVFVTWSSHSDWFAVTWSDGGAIGNFHTRVFHVKENRVEEADSVQTAFANFRRRHWCRTRGDNVQAYGWDRETGTLVLVTSVYPTGDCGKDLGHTEAYLVEPAGGSIRKHLTLPEFNAYAKSHAQ